MLFLLIMIYVKNMLKFPFINIKTI